MLVDPDGNWPLEDDSEIDLTFGQKVILGNEGFQNVKNNKIKGNNVVNEVIGVMKSIRDNNESVSSPLTDYVDYDKLKESEEMEYKRTQHHGYYLSKNNEDSPKAIIGHNKTEVVNEVYIVNESNIEISYYKQDGQRRVNYSSNGKTPFGVIRVVVPARDQSASGGHRTTGLQLRFDMTSKTQYQSFKMLNAELGGLRVIDRLQKF